MKCAAVIPPDRLHILVPHTSLSDTGGSSPPGVYCDADALLMRPKLCTQTTATALLALKCRFAGTNNILGMKSRHLTLSDFAL